MCYNVHLILKGTKMKKLIRKIWQTICNFIEFMAIAADAEGKAYTIMSKR